MDPRGQVSGHPGWDTWLEGLVREHGSWTAVAERLVAARGHQDELASVERALRRLRGRGALPGGVWGRRLLAAFGPPADVTARLRFMGSYHSRFVDLPVPLCADLLRLWDRPPASESREGRAWLALARGSLALRERRYDDAAAAFASVRAEDPAAAAEAALGTARLATRGDPHRMPDSLDVAEDAIRGVTGPDHANLAARLAGQRAWVFNRRGEPARGEALHRALPDGPEVPAFARARRENGLAYARHAAGDPGSALAHARASARAAGDAGHVRLRAMALLMIARVAAGTPEADEARARARAIAMELQDAVLLGRA
jgi:hypothetical protein